MYPVTSGQHGLLDVWWRQAWRGPQGLSSLSCFQCLHYSSSNQTRVLCVVVCAPTRRVGDLLGQRNILLKAKAVLTRGLAGVDNICSQQL